MSGKHAFMDLEGLDSDEVRGLSPPQSQLDSLKSSRHESGRLFSLEFGLKGVILQVVLKGTGFLLSL